MRPPLGSFRSDSATAQFNYHGVHFFCHLRQFDGRDGDPFDFHGHFDFNCRILCAVR